MRLLHYSDKPVKKITRREQDNEEYFTYQKPTGLWVSVEGEDDWLSWCRAESFGLEQLKRVHEVILSPDANILRIGTKKGIDAFTEEFGKVMDYPIESRLKQKAIQWRDVADRYQGIIIAPYVWERRLHVGTDWYYAWDCASGCIWEPKAIADIRLLPQSAL